MKKNINRKEKEKYKKQKKNDKEVIEVIVSNYQQSITKK